MIDVNVLREYFKTDKVFVTNHVANRFRERSIRVKDVREAVLSGNIIEQYEDDFPYPSCLIFGYSADKRPIHVVLSDEGTSSRIITAYIPDDERWEKDYITRKERNI